MRAARLFTHHPQVSLVLVAGIDFGTLSVRVSLFDSGERSDTAKQSEERGARAANPTGRRLGFATAEYPLHRKREDPDYATQSHADHMAALTKAMREAISTAGIDGHQIAALAIDTTGSSVIPVDARMNPVDDYYLWCDHRAWREAAEITTKARAARLKALDYCGGTYSSEWGWAKLLHWLRNNPAKRGLAASAFEHCDMAAATLCGITDPAQVKRSICAMGHKWMWNASLGGLPPEDFLAQVDPLLPAFREKLQGGYATSDQIAGGLSEHWAKELGLKPGIPIPVGAFDAHWDALGAGAALGDVVNIVGTSTCIVAMSEKADLIPGLCGVVQGSVDPRLTGIEAGMSATGDVFDAIARRAGKTVRELSEGLEHYRAGQTGMLRMPWDNGDRTILVNPEVSGVTIGWKLTHTAQDELFAAIEGCAFHTRVILEHMERHGVPILRVINGGGIPQRNNVLNQVYADVLNKPVLVPSADVTSLGSAIFAFLAAGTYRSVAEAQKALCPDYKVFEPRPETRAPYDELFTHFKSLYFEFGRGELMPSLRRIAREAHS
ncbi:MAG: ribulokinase [Acidobacteriota bacterium]|nr:ribulokinase [Acidobacteriota bacterium]